MTNATRRSIALGALATMALIGAACGSAAVAPAATGSDDPSAVASVGRSAAPTAAVSTRVATSTPGPSTACAATPQTGILPSDRFTDLKFAVTADADVLTFVFGEPSLAGAPAPPIGSLEVARPPYRSAGSGEAIDVIGEHVLQMTFTGMSLSNDAGQESYLGRPELKDLFPVLRHAVIYDMSEGVVGWYVGYNGPGCVTLSQSNGEVRLALAHP
jgi:hypothetical protein